ncbi:MAG: hypothetical protein JXB06_12630 [Spirochaetales bacterium]|nr:hypothetical protein [Spirochaetales bacterium]
MRRPILVCLLLLAGSALLFAQFPVALSHYGKINDLIYDAERRVLFSAGEDGTVRIWNAEAGQLIDVVRISHKPLQRLAVHPTEQHLAVLVGDSLQGNTLEVWNWQRRQRLFGVDSGSQLMHFAYSPGGTYLFYSRADYKSLTAVNPRTGRVLPYMGRGFGIVSYFTVARNEGNIMTYQPSGSITYWDIRSGRMVKQLRAPADLETVCISPNNRYIAASMGDQLLVVDILSGEVVDRSRVGGIVDLSFSTAGNEIAGVVEGEGGREAKKWYFGGRFLIELSTSFAGRFPALNRIAYGDRDLYLATSDGTIAVGAAGGEATVVVEDTRRGISDFAFWGGEAAVASSSEIVIFDSEFFLPTYDPDAGQGPDVREIRYSNPFSCDVGITYLDAQRLLIWCRGGQEGKAAVLDTWYGNVHDLPVELGSPIRHVWASEQGIIVVQDSGRCRILDPDTYAVTFQYNAPGMNRLIQIFGDTLIGAKTHLSALSGPLLQINRRTGETVPIQDPSLFVYDLFYDGADRGGGLYTLAVEQNAGRVRTVVKVRTGFAFERSRVLKSFDGEDLGATLTGDRSGGVFTSLGYGAVTVFRNSRTETLDPSGQIPRKLAVHNGKIFSLNRDSSISVWELSSRRLLYNIQLFEDRSWGAMSPDGVIRLSREEDSH